MIAAANYARLRTQSRNLRDPRMRRADGHCRRDASNTTAHLLALSERSPSPPLCQAGLSRVLRYATPAHPLSVVVNSISHVAGLVAPATNLEGARIPAWRAV